MYGVKFEWDAKNDATNRSARWADKREKQLYNAHQENRP